MRPEPKSKKVIFRDHFFFAHGQRRTQHVFLDAHESLCCIRMSERHNSIKYHSRSVLFRTFLITGETGVSELPVFFLFIRARVAVAVAVDVHVGLIPWS